MKAAALRTLAVVFLVAGACSNDVSDTTNFCANPWGVGPDGTQGVCGVFELCVPADDVTCLSNNCCHAFCSYEACGPNVAEVSISPDLIPDGGAAGCGCTVADAGSGCVCAADGGLCFLSSCLCVCGD